MAILKSRQDLVDYALRQLGAPILNIEIDEDQLTDAIEEALSFFHEYHFEGMERDYAKHKITGTVLTLDDASPLTVGVTITNGVTSSSILEISGNNVTISKMIGPSKFQINDVISFAGGTAVIENVVLGDVDNGWLPMTEDISSVIRIIPFQGYSDGLFDITYQLRMNDLRSLSSSTMSYFSTSMEYLSLLDFLLRKEKQFRYNRRMNKMYLDIDWRKDVSVNDFLIIECYRAIDADEYTNVFNDPWLKKYAVSLIKKQWGTNLKKYSNISLPGGVTLNGNLIYDEAILEIEKLENSLIYNQAPTSFFMG